MSTHDCTFFASTGTARGASYLDLLPGLCNDEGGSFMNGPIDAPDMIPSGSCTAYTHTNASGITSYLMPRQSTAWRAA